MEVPADVVVADRSPQGLLERLRAAGLSRDAFLLGGRSTLHAFLALAAVDRLELLEFPRPPRRGGPLLAARHATATAAARGAPRLP